LYLPQYHRIKENDIWWGEGYTEWTAVKNAVPLFHGHKQPRVPLNNNYYDLKDESASTWKWQADLVNEYGIFGFSIYHYWFKGRQLLEKPMEILLSHKEINLKYCICWANESWTRTWYGLENEVLLLQEYGNKEDWENHFNYLLQFFNDERYIKVDGKPVINIYKSSHVVQLESMLDCWRSLALKSGFNGIYVVVANNAANDVNKQERRIELVDAFYDFEPGYSTKNNFAPIEGIAYYSKIILNTICNMTMKTQRLERIIDIRKIYRKIYSQYSRDKIKGKPTFPGIFPMWDNTPRRGYKGMVYVNASPELFYDALKHLCGKTLDGDFIYINAWNEWGEGCYLEPDTENGFAYLEAIRKCIKNT